MPLKEIYKIARVSNIVFEKHEFLWLKSREKVFEIFSFDEINLLSLKCFASIWVGSCGVKKTVFDINV